MDKNFNKRVFETFPDSIWTGEVPAVDKKSARRNVVSPAFRYLIRAAAAACVVFTVVTLLRPAPAGQTVVTGQPVQPETVYQVNDAVRASMMLPDSSTVTLNSGSTLRLAQGFGQTNREVYLDGEALFEVHKDRKLPFLVKSPQGVGVKVTGTRFNLSCYSDQALFDLTLLQGSVEVTTRKNEVLYVLPSEEVIIRDGFHNISPKDTPEDAVVWTDGILRFDHTSMKDAISKLEKWYGVDIVVENDAVYRNSISGAFDSESLDDVLQLICITSRLKYRISDRTVYLSCR